MANLITRGFGALQRVITRGFFSASKPSEDCYIPFIGKITIEDNTSAFVGPINNVNGFSGELNTKIAAFNGTMKDINGFEGELCDVCDC